VVRQGLGEGERSTARFRVGEACVTPPGMTFLRSPTERFEVITWPGRPTRQAVRWRLAALVSDAGPLVHLTLALEQADGAREAVAGWVPRDADACSWFDERVATVVGAVVRDLAGNVASYGEPRVMPAVG
jgi:hypothetical protein